MTIHIKDSFKKVFNAAVREAKKQKAKTGNDIEGKHCSWAGTSSFAGDGFAQQERVDLCHTSEFLFLLLSHPVDGEAGCSSKTTAQNFLVGLSLPVSNRTVVLCGKYIHKLKFRNFPRGSLLIIKIIEISRDYCSKA